LEARTAHREGRLTRDELREIEDKAILDALEMQRQAGIDVYTDGEYRRQSFLTVLTQSVEGFGGGADAREWRGPGGEIHVVSSGAVVTGKLRKTRRLTADQVRFLKQHSPGPFKITLPTPAQFMFFSYKPGITDRFYPSRSELREDLVGIIGGEMRALADEGVPYIQMDAPNFTDYVDRQYRERMRQSGVDPDRAIEESIAASNACFEGVRRPGITLAAHLCRGNQRSRWLKEGSYEPIAERLFTSLQVDRFLLEYDTDRAGGFEPLRFVPKGKTIGLGLISTKDPRLESQETLLQRIEEASRHVPLENLAIAPQCGFASSLPGNLLSLDDQRRKLERVAETARKVWG
jgi:5-methyltetrahydropteroyltriglutamate--homocysteine methyltransferase